MAQLIDLGKLRFHFAGNWQAGVTYERNDIVKYGGNIYVYTYALSTSGFLPTNTTYWSLMVEGFKFVGEWSSTTAYKIGDGITHGGKVYIAHTDNTNQIPPNTNYWSQFADGIQYEGTYSNTATYQKNDIVVYGNSVYLAKANTTGNLPSNTSYWDTLINGISYKGEWTTGTAYVVDDVVKDGISTYICLQNHTAGVSFATDIGLNYWEFFARGADDVLPLVSATDTGKSLTVAADGINYEWISATGSNKVFYVAPHGTDTVNSGKSLATPFATLKYATQQCGTNATIFVKTGTYSEQLPITVPATVAIVGDNQRTVIIQPATGLSDDGVTPNSEATMFLLSNGSILNKMTFQGLTGWVPNSTTPDDISTSTPKGVVARLNPASPVTTKSPYILECSAIGSGLIGAYVDGNIHASGNKSMIFHGYTVISDNGVGYWMANGAKSEIVSCFTYYCYFGYATTHGAQIRALNGNNSYGTWGAVSIGFDDEEVPLTASVLGRRLDVLAISGNFAVGDTITGGTSGATAVVTNMQENAGYIYVKNITGTFAVAETVTATSGGTASVGPDAMEDQKGFVIVVDGLSALPRPGNSIQFSDDSLAYVIQSFSGTYVNSSSEIVLVLSQEKPTGSADNTAVTIRQNFSQIRLTGHDFLNVGTGGITTTNYPGIPTQPPAQGNEINEVFPGRVYYVSTDQDGNFRVGEYFKIDQATGKATLNANAFDLAGLTSLRLGSIGAQLGETINEFSSDTTLSGNSNLAVPTEAAVKTYVDNENSKIAPFGVVSVSANQAVLPGRLYTVDSSVGAITLTLPATPVVGQTVQAVDAGSTAETNNITIDGNGNKIVAVLENFIIDVSNASITLVYINTTYGWGVL